MARALDVKKTSSSKEAALQLLLITLRVVPLIVGASIAMLCMHRAIDDVFETEAASNGTAARG